MAQTTYRKFAQEILDAHYGNMPTPEAGISHRFIAEWAAMLVAKAAVKNAYMASNSGESTYSDDQFITSYYNNPLLTDGVTGDKYFTLPATPAGLPNDRGISQVSFAGAPNVQCINCRNYMAFAESLLPPMPGSIVLYKVENGNVVFLSLPPIINSPVNTKLVGAIPSAATILDAPLQIPKDVEADIRAEILNGLVTNYKIQPNNSEQGVATS